MVNLDRNNACSITHYYSVNRSDGTVRQPTYMYANENCKLSINFSPFPMLIHSPEMTRYWGDADLGSYFNVLLMLVLARYYKWNMEWASQLKRDPQMPVHTISSSMSLRLRWTKTYTKFCDCRKNRPKFSILSV